MPSSIKQFSAAAVEQAWHAVWHTLRQNDGGNICAKIEIK